MLIDICFDFLERNVDMFLHEVQKSSSERVAEQGIVEMFYMTPKSYIAGTALGKQYMNMRVPFQVSAEGMKNANKSGSEILGFVLLISP